MDAPTESLTHAGATTDAALDTQAQLRDVTTSTGVHRLRFLDGIRGLAALYVVISHVWDTAFGTRTPGNAGLRSATAFLGFGRYAVAVFIVVSGFSIGLGAWKGGLRWPGGWRTYVRRRVTRIWPPYAVAVLISSLVAATVLSSDDGTLFDAANNIRASGVITHLFLVQDLHWAGPAGSSAFWSIPVEFHIYFFFLLALVTVRRWRDSWMAWVVGLMVLTVITTLGHSVAVLHWVAGLYPSLYALFLVGFAASAGAARGVAFDMRKWRLFLVAMFAGGCLIILVCRARYSALSPLNDYVVGPLCALLVSELVFGRLRPLARVLQSRVAVWLGDCSYSVYLIHAVVLEGVWRVAIAPVTTDPLLRLVLELVIGVGASVVIGRLFYLAFERPFLRVRVRGAAQPNAKPAGKVASRPPVAAPESVA